MRHALLTPSSALLTGAVLATAATTPAPAGHLPVHGGPTFSSSAGGYVVWPDGPPVAVNDRGEAVGYARRHGPNGQPLGQSVR